MKWVFAAALVAGLAAVTWAVWPKPIPVDIATLAVRPLAVTVSDDGTTRIRDIFTVSAPVGGKLTRSPLKEGDEVIANESVIATIMPGEPVFLDARSRREAEAAAEAAQAAVTLADVLLLEAEARHNFALSDLRRAQTLIERNTISPRRLEEAELEVARSAAEVGSARATANMRRQELASARARLIQPGQGEGKGKGASQEDACCVSVSAPTSGVVVNVMIESEQVIAAGTPILEIGDPQDLEVVVDLLSRDAVRVDAGDRATLDGWGGPPLPATVRRVEPAARTEISALGIEEQRVEVLLDVDVVGAREGGGAGPAGEGARLGHNYRVVAHIVVWENEDALAVPLGALFRAGERWAVFVVEDGRARLTPVEIGARGNRFAEVVAGLSEGATVVVHPSDRVAEGARVTPRKVQATF